MSLIKLVSVITSLTLIATLIIGCECGTSTPSDAVVKINEVTFDPYGEDIGREWVELFNADIKSHNIEGWVISNQAGDAIATLPAWTFPPNSYLLIAFGTGTDDSDFADGIGAFNTQVDREVLDNIEDEIALYSGPQKSSNMVDFVSWCSDGDYNPGKAHSHAFRITQWPEGAFLDIGYPSGKSVVAGFSIGRDGSSTDTDSPDDWDRNGGRDAYFDTPGLTNAGPYFTTDWGIKLTQTKVNLLLLHFGYQVTHASHEVVSEEQSTVETYVRAKHSFTTTLAKYKDTFSGIGEYHWSRVSSKKWQDEIAISLADSTADESYSLNYTREYEDTGLSLIISESLEGIYSYEVFDEEEVLPDVDVALEPLPEASTHTEQKMFSDISTTTITQLALGQYRVETISNKHLPFRDENQIWSFTKDYRLVTDTQMEATTELEVTSSFREWQSLTISTEYVMDTPDVGWHRAHDLGNVDVSYSKYVLSVGNDQNYSLVEPGFFRMTKRQAADYYDIESLIKLSDGAGDSFNIAYSGHIEKGIENGELIFKGQITDPGKDQMRQFYIDGLAGGAIGGGACAVAGAAIGVWWVGIGGIIGAGIGGIVCGVGGALIEEATEPDTTEPDIDFEILDWGSDKEKGWMRVKVTVSDDTEVTEWSVNARSEEGNTLANRTYKPESQSDSKVFPLYNRHCTKRTITLTVSATDSSGNPEPAEPESQQFSVPARICTPNIEETEPANEDVSVPVGSQTKVTFCKPMDTAATEAAFSFSPHIDFTVSWSYYNNVATLTPTSLMDYGTTYTMTISIAARSFAGLPLEEPYTFSFTTEEKPKPPEVLHTLPPHGGVVSLETDIQILFSKPMDKDATTQALLIFPGIEYEVFWEEGNQLMVIHPLVPWESGIIYEVTITTEASAEDGLNIGDDYTFVFFSEEPSS